MCAFVYVCVCVCISVCLSPKTCNACYIPFKSLVKGGVSDIAPTHFQAPLSSLKGLLCFKTNNVI